MKGVEYLDKDGSKATLKVGANNENIILMTRESSYGISYSESLKIERSVKDLINSA